MINCFKMRKYWYRLPQIYAKKSNAGDFLMIFQMDGRRGDAVGGDGVYVDYLCIHSFKEKGVSKSFNNGWRMSFSLKVALVKSMSQSMPSDLSAMDMPPSASG